MAGKRLPGRHASRTAFRPGFDRLEFRGLLSAGSIPTIAGASPAAEVRSTAADPGFTPLFGPSGLAGWRVPYDWGSAVNRGGQIVLNGTRKFFLVSPRTYSDFVLRGEANVPTIGNSGIQFRSHFRHNNLWGYQMELSPGPGNLSGGLWYEGRNWLAYPSRPNLAQPNRWNRFEITAIGKDVTLVVNGVTALRYHRAVEATGYLALQDHGWGGSYRFRNLEIQDLSSSR